MFHMKHIEIYKIDIVIHSFDIFSMFHMKHIKIFRDEYGIPDLFDIVYVSHKTH